MLDNRYAILFIRGELPVMDLKYQDKKDAVRRLSVILFDPHLPSILLFF